MLALPLGLTSCVAQLRWLHPPPKRHETCSLPGSLELIADYKMKMDAMKSKHLFLHNVGISTYKQTRYVLQHI